MDLDNLPKAAKEIKAPQIVRAGASGATNMTDNLLQEIKAADEKERRQTRKALPFYIVAAVPFAVGCVAFFLGSSSGYTSRAINYGVLAAILMLVSILMTKKLHSIRALDYSKPVLASLAETQDRYRFLRPWDFGYMIPLLLVLAVTGGLSLAASLIPRYFAESQRITVWIVYGLFFVGVCCMGFYFSFKNWKLDKGGILEEIQRMRRELGSE